MSDRNDKQFVQHSIDTGLADLQGNPFLAQRIMNQERTEQPVMKKKISFAFILAIILLLACAATAIAGALNEDFNNWLYRIWPEAAMKLMPLDLSCEDQGIRMSLINAVAENNEVYLTFSMEDLEGDRIGWGSHTYMDFKTTISGATDSEWSNEYGMYNPDTKQLIYGEHLVLHSIDSIPENNAIAAIVPWIGNDGESTYIDLMPMLEKYGDQPAVTNAPSSAECIYDDTWHTLGDLSSSTYVLDWNKSTEIPLNENISISGIGMVDGLLHVQVHNVNYQEIIYNIKNSFPYDHHPENAYVYLYDADEEYGYDSKEKYEYTQGINYLTWKNPLNKSEQWQEFIFRVDSGLTEKQVLTAEIHHPEPPIIGNWHVTIPVRMIRKK